jgi:PAS domain S-box-containing protein
MRTKIEQFSAINPNPVLSVEKDGTVIYSNEAGETLLNVWGVKMGGKLPLSIVDLVQKVISQNNPEKIEVKAGNKVFLVAFHLIPREELVNIYGFDISCQKEFEEKLQESENKYRNIVETSVEGIWIFNAVSETTYVNEKMAEMLGYNREEMIGKFIWDFADEEDKCIFQVKLANRKKGIDEVYELKLIRKDGSLLWVSVSAKAFFDNAGKFAGSVGMFTDTTERKRVEEVLKNAHETLEEKVKERTSELEDAIKSLEESEKGLAEAQKMAHIGNWDWDIATDKAYWSDELYYIYGLYSQKLAPSYNEYLSYIHLDDREYAINVHKEALNGKPFSMDHRIILANGEERTVHIQTEVIFNEKNVPIKLKGTVQDITERKKVEEKLRESEEKYRNIVETANEGILITDNENIITYVNKKFADMLRYSIEEVIGRPIWGLISEEYRPIVTMHLEKRRLGKSESYELKSIRKDGSSQWVLLNAKPLFDKDGKYTGAMSMLTDITKRKEAEDALTNIEIARKKEIHHRIKNNLQIISSLLDLQAEKFRDRKDIQDSEVLDSFIESQNRVASMALIHEELYKDGNIDTLNVSSYIKKLADNLFLAYKFGNTKISLNMDMEENVYFDMDTAVPLGIIVNELISNSLKHAFKGREKGEIRIKILRDENGECKSEGYKSTNFILIVSDNGIGIHENFNIEELNSLGLQLVVSLVDQLDGELELKRNNGTEFSIRFTVSEKNNPLQMPASSTSNSI